MGCGATPDSGNDYRALKTTVQDSYDQAKLNTVNNLHSSIFVAADGSLRLNSASVASSLPDANPAQRRHLFVGLTPLPAKPASPQTLTLLGETDLPSPPGQTSSPPDSAATSPIVWYDAVYRDYPVRMLALRSQLADGHGQRFELLIQAAEDSGPRNKVHAGTLEQQVLRDARMMLLVIALVWLGVSWSLRPLERLRKSVLQNRGSELRQLDTEEVPSWR